VEEVHQERVGLVRQNHPWREREVVVLEPDGRVLVDVLESGVGELLVDLAVVTPVVPVEVHPTGRGVTEWPQRLVRVSVVVAPDLFLGESQTLQRVGRVRRRDPDLPVAIGHREVGLAVTPRDPGAVDAL